MYKWKWQKPKLTIWKLKVVSEVLRENGLLRMTYGLPWNTWRLLSKVPSHRVCNIFCRWFRVNCSCSSWQRTVYWFPWCLPRFWLWRAAHVSNSVPCSPTWNTDVSQHCLYCQSHGVSPKPSWNHSRYVFYQSNIIIITS